MMDETDRDTLMRMAFRGHAELLAPLPEVSTIRASVSNTGCPLNTNRSTMTETASNERGRQLRRGRVVRG
jgi:hypothetical protein